MRVTVCEACGGTDPKEFPMGWVLVAVVIGTSQENGILGPRDKTEYERHAFCSTACLAAYVALEGVRGETA